MTEHGEPAPRPQAVPEDLLPHLRRARDLADRHYAEPLDLDGLAAVAGVSKYHFPRCFATTYGKTPAVYLAERRIERARDLQRATNVTVTEVCMLRKLAGPGRAEDVHGRRPRPRRAVAPTAQRWTGLTCESRNRLACKAFHLCSGKRSAQASALSDNHFSMNLRSLSTTRCCSCSASGSMAPPTSGTFTVTVPATSISEPSAVDRMP